MRLVVIGLVGVLWVGSAAAQLNVALNATQEQQKACQAKLRGQEANLDLHREQVHECTLEAAVAAGVLPGEVVEDCRKEFAALQKAQAGTVRKCAAFRHFASRMQDSEWRNYAADLCLVRGTTPGHRYQGRAEQCLADLRAQAHRK
jgi:hypothetical protein